ncbi:MAG: MGMT family protein [Candidatus Nanoarchaeia archaeon]|nr:MGMT family protein [Candidatus Nanoarchaeia archaeon]
MKSFTERVWEQLKLIPKGKVASYKTLSEAMNSKAYRAVGSAVKKNPYAPGVPCHRVVKNNGEIGGYSGPGGVKRKIEILKKEGVEIIKNKVDLKKYLYEFR